MTMRFRTLKQSVVTILTAAAAADGTYRVLSSKDQGLGADDVKDGFRTVRVYFSESEFADSKNSMRGPLQHDATLAIELVAAKAAKGDLATLENPASSDAQRAAALIGFQLATDGADDSLDELIDLVFNALMPANATELGLDVGDISNRAIRRIKKEGLPSQGQYAILGATMNLDANVVEDLTGATPLAAEDPATTTSLETHMQDSPGGVKDPAPAEVSEGD